MPLLSEDLAFRGLVHQVTDQELLGRLDRSRICAYIGFDPTADSLHVGHLLQVLLLRRLAEAGHRPIALAGGGTGLVGDPSGRSEERVLLDEDRLRSNLGRIQIQLERLLATPVSGSADGSGALLLDNSEWLGSIGLLEFLREVGKHFGVGEMIAKESVRSRLDRPDQGMSFTEFSYMLLQAYDFLYLYDHYGCRLQMGASDQWGNITMGMELIRKVRGEQASGLTTPLIVKPDGTKFGKTASGTIWLDAEKTSPYLLYQFFVRTEDSMVASLLRWLTFLDHEEILDLDAATEQRPDLREAQRVLARHVCTLVHGPREADRAERASNALYSEAVFELDERTLVEASSEAPATELPRADLGTSRASVAGLLVATGLVTSATKARSALSQGGVYLNNRRVHDQEAVVGPEDLLCGRYALLRRGKRDYHLLRFVGDS